MFINVEKALSEQELKVIFFFFFKSNFYTKFQRKEVKAKEIFGYENCFFAPHYFNFREGLYEVHFRRKMRFSEIEIDVKHLVSVIKDKNLLKEYIEEKKKQLFNRFLSGLYQKGILVLIIYIPFFLS